MFRSLLIMGGVIGLCCVVWSLRHTPKEEKPAEVPRSDLVLLQGRLYRIGQSKAFTGLMVESYEGGLLKSRSMISNGLLHGVSDGWYTNGQLQVREQFKEGVSHGLRAKWYPSGARMSEVAIVDGKLHGTFRRWHENGALAEQIEMHHGKPEGRSWAYYPSGFLKARAKLENGKLVEQKFWKDGEVRYSSIDFQDTN
jgi:hypothetical protein